MKFARQTLRAASKASALRSRSSPGEAAEQPLKLRTCSASRTDSEQRLVSCPLDSLIGQDVAGYGFERADPLIDSKCPSLKLRLSELLLGSFLTK